MTTRIGIIIGSTRPRRRGRLVGEWVATQARSYLEGRHQEAEFELIDLADRRLPLLDEPVPPSLGRYQQEHTRDWAEAIARLDGFVFVTPEYNHSVPAALKNAIDFLFAEWNDKAAGFVGYGSTGAARAVEHLRQVCGEVKMADVRAQVLLSLFDDFEITDPAEPGRFTPRDLHADALAGVFDEVLAWAGALQVLRAGRESLV